MSLSYTQTDVHTTEWDTHLEMPIFSWSKYTSGETFRDSARRWEAVMVDRGVERYMVNTETVTVHDDDKRWLAETWIPDLIDHGVRSGAGVYADSAIASMDMQGIGEKLSSIHPNYEFRVFGSEAKARSWLTDQ